MAESEERREKREHKRFLAKDLAYARFLLGVGTLVNISRRGVSFQYAQDSGDDWDPLKGSMKLDLFKIQPFRKVTGVECDVVYDTAVPWEIGVFGYYQMRRCGVQFGELSSDQSSELDSFIKDFNVQEN